VQEVFAGLARQRSRLRHGDGLAMQALLDCNCSRSRPDHPLRRSIAAQLQQSAPRGVEEERLAGREPMPIAINAGAYGRGSWYTWALDIAPKYLIPAALNAHSNPD